ncbi:MtrAB system histidine kinase MtrB [Demequina lignilytica]|uniref:Sensor histidine kinase MtrB n=1 Tax=Demequina lignilytica TaxID=3051663 RepID=A0AAW7M9T0_9MICO|nr:MULTISPECIES: MtrAB system histidine kinase MtrB [unclassified Demequina]MDN4478279.1 MtrAB system histidine kinase MtrB [Demequina sp. SYSU T00039-1]MDN4482645.1 MtrAB system histidine kinase MtrB [Demequina sp. SYSU T0a273]MDN4488271.1 MtrAB system histidine kinase MtrB [Demequina sp. SYSU T00039]MDN4490182.1 MtrAB system histidine kinase MtrB [Demequina sp. SYSU T00068]
MRLTPRSLWANLASRPRRVWRRFRGSLLLRVVATTLVLGLTAVGIIGAAISSQIRDGLVQTRVDRILAETARDADSAQQTVDASTAETPGDLQQLVNDLFDGLGTLGGDTRGLVLLRDPTNTSGVLLSTPVTSTDLVGVISPEMREAVESDVTQPWQFVEMPGTGDPGVVVGSMITIRVAGDYELYFVYSLADEAATLSLIQRVLGAGAVALMILLGLLTLQVSRQTVRPVRQAARVASRLAEGILSERMTVRGQDEMATLARTFNEMAESLQRQITRMEELSRLQRRFVSDVSHELRTPLTTIRMASDVLHDAREGFPPAVARSAELLDAQIDRFETLLSDLLEISRIDAGAAQLEFDDMSLADVVRDQTEAMVPAARREGVELRLWVAAGDHVASMDRPRVARIVRNLLSNAIEHAQRRPVDVVVASSKRAVAVVVRDYGIGLTPQQVNRVFDRFWRADAARARTMGGTGLGLSIAREDAQLHGGKLEAWGLPGKGASFRLELPRTSRGLGQHPPLPLVIAELDYNTIATRVPLEADRREVNR